VELSHVGWGDRPKGDPNAGPLSSFQRTPYRPSSCLRTSATLPFNDLEGLRSLPGYRVPVAVGRD
jgi:hypothetical protein